MSLHTVTINVNYERQKDVIRHFLRDFEDTPSDDAMVADNVLRKYQDLMQKIANRETDIFLFDLNDLFTFESEKKLSGSKYVSDSIMDNTAHYTELVSDIIDALLPVPTVNLTYHDEVLEVILHHREERNQAIRAEQQMDPSLQLTGSSQHINPEESQIESQLNGGFPPELLRRYTLYFKPLLPEVRHPGQPNKNKDKLAVREVKSSHLGKLITIRGVATRVSDVKPAVTVTAYTCDECGHEAFQEVKARQYMPLMECPSDQCQANGTRGQLFPSTRASKFLAFQEVRLQELADQVPAGHIPRSLTLHLKGPLVRSVKPGNAVDISGIFMPRPYSGFRGLRASLLTDTYLDVQYVHSLKQQYEQQYEEMLARPQLLAQVQELRAAGNVYERLASSIAPEIYGHLDVKKALLLMLIGGVTKEVKDGMKIRGNINLCLMGDPGIAKSQLLKFIVKVAPRGVYTTGRGSSGVGLTAAIMRDPVTDETILEGGALVLADNGICCIDEFDKMEDADRTAIHEVMEQQTISIAKAGIATSLNARTSILAAANPVYGRYNPRLSPVENINLPAALLSRFDLLFLQLDTPSTENDRRLAEHVAYVHRHNHAPEITNTVPPELIQHYIAEARSYRPVFSKEIADLLSSSYVQMRQRHKRDIDSGKQFGYITPRALLSIMRMAQALARLRFSNEVCQEDVDEALRLNEVSKQSLQSDISTSGRESIVSTVYQIIVEIFAAFGTNSVPMRDVRERVAHKGYTLDELNNTLQQYTDMGLLLITSDDQLEKV